MDSDGESSFFMKFVRFNDLKDCNVTVSFVNDSSVFYGLDVELYSPALGSSPFTVKDSEDAYGVGLIFTVTSRIRSVNLVLGTSIQYDISFDVCSAAYEIPIYHMKSMSGGMMMLQHLECVRIVHCNKYYLFVNYGFTLCTKCLRGYQKK